MTTLPATEVLRGMNVESAPLHLLRPRSLPQPVAGTSPAEPIEDAAVQEASRRSLEEAVRQGREEGMRAGYEAGMRKGLADAAAQAASASQKAQAAADAEYETRRDRVECLAGRLQAAVHDALAAAEDEMVALCFETLCRMIGSAAPDESAVRGQLLALARHARPGELLALHVHPSDLAVVQGRAEDASAIPWVADPGVEVGGCVLRRKGGALDARLDAMLEACKASLLAARAQRHREAGERS